MGSLVRFVDTNLIESLGPKRPTRWCNTGDPEWSEIMDYVDGSGTGSKGPFILYIQRLCPLSSVGVTRRP